MKINFNRLLYSFFFFLCLITLFFMVFYIYLMSNISFNGGTILIVLFMLINPMQNCYRKTKKIVVSPVYYFLNIILSGFIMFLIINCLIIYFKESPNTSSLFFGNNLLKMYGISMIIALSSNFFKKIEEVNNSLNLTKILIITIVLSILPFFSDGIVTLMGINIGIIFFCVILLVSFKNQLSSDVELAYWTMIILCLIVSNPISAILLASYLFQKQV